MDIYDLIHIVSDKSFKGTVVNGIGHPTGLTEGPLKLRLQINSCSFATTTKYIIIKKKCCPHIF